VGPCVGLLAFEGRGILRAQALSSVHCLDIGFEGADFLSHFLSRGDQALCPCNKFSFVNA
jgi:hypothetical protein